MKRFLFLAAALTALAPTQSCTKCDRPVPEDTVLLEGQYHRKIRSAEDPATAYICHSDLEDGCLQVTVYRVGNDESLTQVARTVDLDEDNAFNEAYVSTDQWREVGKAVEENGLAEFTSSVALRNGGTYALCRFHTEKFTTAI